MSRCGSCDASRFVALITPKLRAIPSSQPARIGTRLSTAASCIRQNRICPGVAPILEKIPNWWIRAFMDTAKELWMIKIREKDTKTSTTR